MLKNFKKKFFKWAPKVYFVLFFLAGILICVDHKKPLEGIGVIAFISIWYAFFHFASKDTTRVVHYNPEEDEKLREIKQNEKDRF